MQKDKMLIEIFLSMLKKKIMLFQQRLSEKKQALKYVYLVTLHKDLYIVNIKIIRNFISSRKTKHMQLGNVYIYIY